MWQHAILGSLQVWDFSKLLLKDSTGPPQIWSAKSQDLHDAKLRKAFEFLWNTVAVVIQKICMFCHERGSCSNLTLHRPICPKCHMLDKNPGLKTSRCPYWVVVIAPPADNRKSALCYKHHLIYVKFTWLINSGCSLAPQSGHKKWHFTRSHSVR